MRRQKKRTIVLSRQSTGRTPPLCPAALAGNGRGRTVSRRLGAGEGGDQRHCETPKAPAGVFVLVRRHSDGAELWDFFLVSRRALLADLGMAQGRTGSRAIGRELGDVLCGIGARRQEGRSLPEATLLRAERAPTGSRPNVTYFRMLPGAGGSPWPTARGRGRLRGSRATVRRSVAPGPQARAAARARLCAAPRWPTCARSSATRTSR